MQDKVFIKGELVAVCPVCGLQIPITVADLINESEVQCPAGEYTAHPDEHIDKKIACQKECKPSFKYHTFKLSKDNIVEYN
ncbi:MAG: hypothetical protein J6D03_00850 [Clostridia bacterium]|nr:hypothetical protein [Clostridia bacterium]